MTTKNKAEWRKATLPEKEDKIMEERAMTGEEVLQEIIGALNGNGMQQAANGVYELCAYVDSMTKKVEDMTDEISALRDYIQKMEDDKLTNKLKNH